MPLFDAIRLALHAIRAQKLKSFFSLVGAFVGVTFLIAVVSIVNGMDRYMREQFAGKLFGVNTFSLVYRPRVQFGEDPHDLLARGRVEVARGLVGQDERRLVYQGPGHGHALPLAAR